MATTIQIKRSATADSAGTLSYGELAYSFKSGVNKLWLGPSSGDPVVVGGKYYTDLFKSTSITDGKNETGKLLMTDSTNGNLLMEAGDITGVGDLHSSTIGVGTNASPELEITGTAITAGGALTIGSTGNLVLNGELGSSTTVKDENDMTSNSATHLATQQSIKAYVDTTAGAVTTISQLNSSVVVADTGTGSISNTVDANETLNIAAAAATFKADNLDVSLKSADDTTADGSSDTNLTHRETGGVALARITGSHDQAGNDKRGKLILQTQPLTASPTDSTLQNVMTLDSNKKVTIHGDLQVDGTQTQLNTTTYTVDDPTLILGGDFGTITGFSSSHSGTSWTDDSETIVVATGGKGTNAKFKVVVDGTTHTVTLEEGGVGYAADDSLTLAGVGGGDDITVTVTTVTTNSSTEDDKERGIAFHYHDGTAARLGFFGIIGNDTDKNKFTFIPNASESNNSFSGNKGTIIAATFEGALTGDVTGNVSGTAATVTGATQANITTAASLTTVGTLTTGGITAASNFVIDTGGGNITTGGKLILDVDATGSGAAGSLSFGATGGAADAEMYWSGSAFVVNTGGNINLNPTGGITINEQGAAGDGFTYYHDLASANPHITLGTSATEDFEILANIGTDKGLDSITFTTTSADDTTADIGKYIFNVDGSDIFEIVDAGLKGSGGTPTKTLDNFVVSGGTY